MDEMPSEKNERKPIVSFVEGAAMADSRDVAATFGRKHQHVLEAYRNCHCSAEFRRSNFRPFKINDLTGESLSHVLMTKNGFAFLVLGFTGAEAGAFKEAYIERFDAMEAELRAPGASEARSITADDLLRNPRQLLAITQGYALQIEDMRRDMAVMQKDVDALDRLAGCEGNFGIRQSAKALSMPERKFTEYVQKIGWCFRQRGSNHLMGYAEKDRAGYLTHKLDPYTKPDGTEAIRETLRFKPAGLVRLAKMLNVTLNLEETTGAEGVA